MTVTDSVTTDSSHTDTVDKDKETRTEHSTYMVPGLVLFPEPLPWKYKVDKQYKLSVVHTV